MCLAISIRMARTFRRAGGAGCGRAGLHGINGSMQRILAWSGRSVMTAGHGPGAPLRKRTAGTSGTILLNMHTDALPPRCPALRCWYFWGYWCSLRVQYAYGDSIWWEAER